MMNLIFLAVFILSVVAFINYKTTTFENKERIEEEKKGCKVSRESSLKAFFYITTVN